MNINNLITHTKDLNDIDAWNILEPYLKNEFNLKLWNYAAKIAARLQNYNFLAHFYEHLLQTTPNDEAKFLKFLDALLKSQQYDIALQKLSSYNQINEAIDKIYQRLLIEIDKNFTSFSIEQKQTYISHIQQFNFHHKKLCSKFIHSIITKSIEDSLQLIQLQQFTKYRSHIEIFLNLTEETHSIKLSKLALELCKHYLFEDAYKLISKTFSLTPFSAKSFEYAYILLQKSQNYYQFLDDWLHFIQKQPQILEYQILLARNLMICEKFEDCYTHLQNALKNYPNSEELLLLNLEILFLTDKFDEALKFIEIEKYKFSYNHKNFVQLKAKIALCLNQQDELQSLANNALETQSLEIGFLIKILLSLHEDEKAYTLYHQTKVVEELKKHFPEKVPKKVIDYNILYKNTKINKKTLILNGMLGLGDEIRFSTIFDTLHKILNDFTIVCDDRLYNLYKATYPNINFIPLDTTLCITNPLKDNVQLKNCINDNVYSHILKSDLIGILPQFLTLHLQYHKTFYESKHYLKVNETYKNYWKNWLNATSNKPKIGLFWRSDITSYTSVHKKTNLEDWIEVFKDMNITIIPLQYGLTKRELDLIHHHKEIFSIAPNLDTKNNIDQLAALISNLDYVVTTAGTTQHLAGAIGTKVLLCCHSYEVNWRKAYNKNYDKFAKNVEIICTNPPQSLKNTIQFVKNKLNECIKQNELIA